MEKISLDQDSLPNTRINTLFKWITHSYLRRAAISVIVILLCLIISFFYLLSYNYMENVYEDETRSVITSLEKSFLKNTVENLIREIDSMRANSLAHYKNVLNWRYEVIQSKSYSCEGAHKGLIADFGLTVAKDGAPEMTVFMWAHNGDILFDSDSYFNYDIETTLNSIKPRMAHYRIIQKDNIYCLIGFSEEFINREIIRAVAEKIKSLQFDRGSYIWVNEVLNYDGGDGYAIRRIHPNLPETEGMLLSTKMADIAGNLPYLEELEGVKANGEVYFSYFFKELESDKVSEKFTYAKLYKDFNWIIAMGIHNNELNYHINLSREKSRTVAFKRTLLLLIFMIVVVLGSVILIISIERWRKRQLEAELEYDTLTNVKSRRFGIQYLTNAFVKYKSNNKKEGIAIMVFDIDNFKEINDKYGHAQGDCILKKAASVLTNTIRSTDEVFRWGGDEFVGVFYGLSEDLAPSLANKIINAISCLEFELEGNTVRTSLSIGISHFKDSDIDISQAIQRADKAMYHSKASGGNTMTYYSDL